MRVIEGNYIFRVAAIDMYMVLDLTISAKFKTRDFENYKGHTFPISHQDMY